MVLRDLEIAGFLFGVETIIVYRRNTGFGNNFQKANKFGNVSWTPDNFFAIREIRGLILFCRL